MRYGSLCSGIEAATVAWHPLGWHPMFFAEIEKFPSAVLAHHYPAVSNLGDITKFRDWPDAAIDVLVGGTPCQSFSVAGLRKGLADPRGNLALTYLAIADRYRPEWLVWENVPGVLSSGDGRDFGAFLGGLGELGYGFAYRVLDAIHFGSACPRRRVFVVGHSGGGFAKPAAVLFERESFEGYRQAIAETSPVFTSTGGMAQDDRTPCILERSGPRIASPAEWERALGFPDGYTDLHELRRAAQTRSAETGCVAEARPSRLVQQVLRQSRPSREERPGGPSNETGVESGVAVQSDRSASGGDDRGAEWPLRHLRTPAAGALSHRPQSPDGESARHPVPRLQSETTDGRGQDEASRGPRVSRQERVTRTPDGPRYKALGNSMAVNVMRWIGRRIDLVAKLASEKQEAA